LSINNLQLLIEDWKAKVVNSLGSFDGTERLAEYALHVSRILAYPNMNVKDLLHRIDSLGQELQLMTGKVMPLRPTQIIETVNNYLFKEKEFKPNLQDYYNPQNSYLNVVLEERSGIPITLSIIYIRVGHFLNFKLYPVNFPGHFLVKHVLEEGETSEIIIDPFNGGRIMDDYALKELLDQFYRGQNIPLTRAFVEKATSAQVLTRLLNNLKGSYYESQNIDKAEIANEMIIAMEPDNPGATRDKGMILLKRKNHVQALSLLNKYLEIEPEAEDADAVLEIIRQIRDGRSKKL
jgi:regulator of sirC expression with transglutaminase-like and TPR domain